MHIQHTAAKMELTLDALENILENSHQIVRQKSIYFHELLNRVLAPYQQEIDKAEISIHYSIEESIPFYTDISRLRIVLSNLLANAITFRDNTQRENEINISVRTTPLKCIIAISDNGEGIEPENHEKIFNLFFRASEKSKGAGIGLYIVQDMLEKLGGSISVDSLPNKGSIVKVTLPNGQPTNN
jgi:signal transduction histidine kinase